MQEGVCNVPNQTQKFCGRHVGIGPCSSRFILGRRVRLQLPNTQGQAAHSDPPPKRPSASSHLTNLAAFPSPLSSLAGENALAIQNHAINFLFAPNHRAATVAVVLGDIFPSNSSNLMEWFSSAKQHFRLQLILGMAAPKLYQTDDALFLGECDRVLYDGTSMTMRECGTPLLDGVSESAKNNGYS